MATVHVEQARRIGRTARALATLPDGSLYLVHSMILAEHCRHLLRSMGRRADAVRIIAPCPTFHRLHGLPRDTRWAVDHAFWGYVRNHDFGAVHELRQLFPAGEVSDEAWPETCPAQHEGGARNAAA